MRSQTARIQKVPNFAIQSSIFTRSSLPDLASDCFTAFGSETNEVENSQKTSLTGAENFNAWKKNSLPDTPFPRADAYLDSPFRSTDIETELQVSKSFSLPFSDVGSSFIKDQKDNQRFLSFLEKFEAPNLTLKTNSTVRTACFELNKKDSRPFG